MKNRFISFLGGLGVLIFAIVGAPAFCAPSALDLGIRVDSVPIGGPQPIICTGSQGDADFLFLKRLDSSRAEFGYDSWSSPIATSRVVTLAPGQTHRLSVVMPSLWQLKSSPPQPSGRLTLTLDGVLILDLEVAFHPREPSQLYFAENPIGGTSCGQFFDGTLTDSNGRTLSGKEGALASLKRHLTILWRDESWRIAPLAVWAALLTAGILALVGFRARLFPEQGSWAPALAIAGCLLAFAYSITGGTFRFNVAEPFGSFYDFQAASVLRGRLDVPTNSLSGEAFVYNGKTYGYFGLTPALLRTPFAALGLAFGKLSRAFMCAYYLGCLVAAVGILRQAVRRIWNQRPRTSGSMEAFFVVAVGLGTPLFFLSSRAYIYHEAILCGAAFAFMGVYFTLRYEAEPVARWWAGAVVCGILSTNARPSSGLFALAFTGCVAAWHLLRERRRSIAGWAKSAHVWVGVACVLGVLSFNTVGYLKFHTFDGAPFKYHVQYDAGRLGRMGGSNFHLSNLRFNLGSYLTSPTFEFRKTFPYFLYTGRDPAGFTGVINGVHYYARNASTYPGIKMDLAEPMLGLTYAMPALCLLATLGAALEFRRKRTSRVAIGCLWAAAVPFCLAMFMAIANAERYTADFCPFLVSASAFGLLAIGDIPGRRPVLGVLSLLTFWSVFTTLALTIHYQGEEVWGVSEPVKEHYLDLGRAADRLFHHLQ